MTFGTGMRELVAHVVRIGRAIVITLVTGPAVRGRAVVLAVRVALCARGIDVSPGQREVGLIVIKCGR